DRISLADDFYDSQTIDSATAHDIYISNWDAFLCNRHDSNFLDLLNVNSALHACMVSELRLRYEHEITVREKFEQKFLKSFEAVQQRDAEIVVLKTKLEKANSEALGVVELHMRVSELEATAATKAEELASLSVQNAKLSGKVSGLESVRDGLMGKVVELESECEYLLNQALDARLSELSYQVDSELYPHMLTAGLEARVEHRIAGRELSAVATFDHGVTTRYEEAVGELENISLPFLDRLESYKDAPLELVTWRVFRMLRMRLLISGSSMSLVIIEVATSGLDDSSLATTVTPLNSLVVADYQISSLAIVDTTVSTAEPYDDLFDATILDKPVDS
ncbi:hypothetical protein Tco_1007194, partial [Tanacetum coccineum]